MQDSERKRRESVFLKLSPGFTFKPRGRAGYIYYKNTDRLLELYVEMSGVPEYDFLIWEDVLEKWVYPTTEPTSAKEQKRISKELVAWLKQNNFKTDYKG